VLLTGTQISNIEPVALGHWLNSLRFDWLGLL
jgi:hypothetical protein